MTVPLSGMSSLTGGGGLSSSSSAAGKSGDVNRGGQVTYNYSGPSINKTNLTPFLIGGVLLVSVMFAKKRGWL